MTERTGNTPDYVAPGGAYLTGGGDWIFISGTGDRVFARIMHAIGRPELIDDAKFRDNKARVANRPALDALIDGWLQQRTTAQVLDVFAAADVPAMKIQSIADLMAHPQVVARGNFVNVPDHGNGDVCLTAPVPRLAQMGAAIRFPGQHVGESTTAILQGELNLSAETMADLRQRRVIG